MGDWRYIWNSKVRHYVEPRSGGSITDSTYAICGNGPSWFSVGGWYGTGKQEEYERIRTLRPCRLCVRRGAPDGPMTDD